MKNFLFIILFSATLFSAKSVYTQDTLRNYNPEHSFLNYTLGNALYYLSRYDLPAPGFVKQIRVSLNGTGDGTVSLFGHEGGSAFGEVKQHLIEPIPFSKTEGGVEFIDFVLDEPVWLDNHQFFVVIDISDSDLQLRTDFIGQSPACSSTSGGTYYPTVIAVPAEHQFYPYLWTTNSRGLVIDVIMEFPIKESPYYFVDVTEEMGIPLNISSNTVAWGDYNNSGYLDLLVGGRLFKNNNGESFTEVTNDLGILGSARGNAFIDINNNGLPDIIIFHNENHLYINNGDETFTHSVLPIPTFPSLSSFSFADLNHDGYPDLFIGQLWGSYPVPMPNYLFFNDGENGFTDETTRIYPEYDGTNNFPGNTACNPDNSNTWISGGNRNRRSRGSQFVDFNNNGHLDLYVANYFLERDELHLNDGEGNFTNIITQTNLDFNPGGGSSHGTGVDWVDYNNNGFMDLLATRLAHPWGVDLFNHKGTTLYKNTGEPDYNFQIVENSGIQFEETHAGGTWGDINNDGLQDLIITTFYGCRYIDLYTQKSDNTFENKTFEYGLQGIVTGRDAVFVDFNNDGKLDLCVGNENRFRLYKNTKPMEDKNWIQIDLQAVNSNHHAIGARVSLTAGGQTYTQEVSAGRGVTMQKPYRLFFGIGQASRADEIVITWPDGNTDIFINMNANNIYLLKEGEGNNVIDEKLPDKISVYPNPANTILNIDSEKNIDKIEIYNITGNLIFSINNVSETPLSVDVSKFSKGIYFVKAFNNGTVYIKKVLLK